MKNEFKIKISYKILSIAISLLLLMGLVAYNSQYRISHIVDDVEELEHFIIPITNFVDQFSINALEQEVHLERILKLYEYEDLDYKLIKKEKLLFEQKSQQVDLDVHKAVLIAREALDSTKTDLEQIENMEPFLEKIEKEHQDFHDNGMELFKMVDSGQSVNEIHQMELKVEEEEDHLNREIEVVLQKLGAFMVKAATLSESHHKKVINNGIIISATAVILGLIYAFLVTVKMVKPLKYLTRRVQKLHTGEDVTPIEIRSRDEVGQLTRTFNRMITELEEKEHLKETFGKYIDPRIVERLEDGGEKLSSTGEKQIVSVLMSDIEEFSTLASSLDSDELVESINQYLDIFSQTVTGKHGFIEFVDTEIKGFWAEPFVQANEHAMLAAESAMEQVSMFKVFHKNMSQKIKNHSEEIKVALENIDLTVGIATGPLILANIGPKWSMIYTVLGDTVNTAARLRGAARQFGVSILLLHETYEFIKDKIAARELGLIKVVGKDDKLRIYELLGYKDSLAKDQEELIQEFSQGLENYRARKWDEANKHFMSCIRIKPEDKPASIYIKSIVKQKERTLPSGWDGVWTLKKKKV